MGKVKKPKPTKLKRSVMHENSDNEEHVPIDSKENAIQTILDQLQAANVEEKYCGLQTLALLIENPENINQVVERGLVKVVAPLLMDLASSVRNAAAGTLRNLSALTLEMCDILMEQDVMTPLICYFHEYAEKWVPDSSSKTKDDDADTFVQCLNLLLNLCESSELAIKYLGQSRILDILLRYLDLTIFSKEIVINTLQCLFVVLEDNLSAMQKIKTSAQHQLQTLLSLEGDDSESDILLIKTLSAGVIINTCGGNIAILPLDIINQIMSILATTLAVNHRHICNQLSSDVPLKDGSSRIEPPKGMKAQMLDKQIKSVLQTLDAQQCSVEIIANICSYEDGDGSLNGNDSSDSDEMDDDNTDQNGDTSILPEDRLPTNVMEALINLDIFDKVWTKTQLPAQNVVMVLKEYDESQLVFKRLNSLQTRSLLCINNLLSTLPIENLGGVNGVYKIWVEIGKLVFSQNSENLVLLESATAVMRAAMDKIKFSQNGATNDSNLFSEMSLTDIEVMLKGIKECQVSEIRSNLIRMIGILALLLVNNESEVTSNVICAITEFILEQALKEKDVFVLAEAVDTLVDLYSEDETDALAAKVKLVDKLAGIAPVLKAKARQQKKLPKKYKVLVSTAISNLPSFIKYKRDRISKL